MNNKLKKKFLCVENNRQYASEQIKQIKMDAVMIGKLYKGEL